MRNKLHVHMHPCSAKCHAASARAGLSWGIYFTAYNNAKMRWQRLRGEDSLPAPLHLLSAAEAGCIVRAHDIASFPHS